MAQVTKEEVGERLAKVKDLIDKDDFKKAKKVLVDIQDAIPDEGVFKPYLAESHFFVAMVLSGLSDFHQALEQLQKALELMVGEKDDRLLANVLRQKGYILIRLGEYDKAKEQVNRSLDISKRLKDQALEGLALMELANILNLKGESHKAIVELRESVLLLEKAGDKKSVARAYNNFASFIHAQGDKERSIDYFDRTIAMSKKAGAIRYMGLAMMNKAGVLIELGRLDEAEKEAEGALKIFKEVGDKFLLAKTYMVCGLVHAEREEWKEAENLVHNAKFMVKSIGMPSSTGVILFEIGKVYMLKGDKKRGLRHINEAKAILDEQKSVIGQKMIEEYLEGLEKNS